MPLSERGRCVDHLLARSLHDGAGGAPLYNRVIEVAGGRIAAVRTATAADARDDRLPAFDLVVPGFIDLQINGAGDVQFNDDPSPEALERIAAGAREGGTAWILPTFITAPGSDYVRAIEAARQAIARGVPGILGVHLEGPFLAPERPGIHDPAAIRPIEEADLTLLADAARALPILLTLAPERLPPGALARLARAGVRVFAGHTAATADEMAAAEAEGLRGATHLFNAMSQMTGREPGAVGAVLASERLFAGLIADGHHVDWRNVRVSARLMPDHLCLVTDAMLTLAGRRRSFDLHGERIELRDGRLTNAEGRLAGAHVSMVESLGNVLRHAGLDLSAALRLATVNPARAIGLEREVGALRPGLRAGATCLSSDLSVTAVLVDGMLLEA